jgi:hypothetical protein
MSPATRRTPDAGTARTAKAAKAKAPLTAAEFPPPQLLPVEELSFDWRNPRVAEHGFGPKTSQDRLLEVLWREMAVDEVAMSIAASGFWQHEPLFAVKEGGKTVVIEGNRRLAALKLLSDDTERARLRATGLPRLTNSQRRQIAQVPVIVAPTRESLWQFLGFKHVNGPVRWSSLAKAEYLWRLHREQGIALEDVAFQIGDTHKTVTRLYRAYSLLRETEESGHYRREDADPKVAISHLYTILDYPGVCEYLGLASTSPEAEAPAADLPKLAEFFGWLWGDRREGKRRVVLSQARDLGRLAEVLRVPSAVARLRVSRSLDEAHDASRGSDVVFADALATANRELEIALAKYADGFDGDRGHLDTAESILRKAEQLLDGMKRKASSARRASRTGS